MTSELKELEHKNNSATYGSSEESTSPIIVSNMTRKRRTKSSNKHKSPENGGFCKKKKKVFEQETTNFSSGPGCSRYSTNNKCVRRNLNNFFCDLKGKNIAANIKIESFLEQSSQQENMYPQLHDVFNSMWGIKEKQSCQNAEKRCQKVQKLSDFESEICKRDLSAVSASPIYNKGKDNTFIEVSKTGLSEASKKVRAHSPLMEFESPVRCSIKSNTDTHRSPLLFQEFDSDTGYDNKNNLPKICTLISNEYIRSDNTNTTPIGKIEQYNTQKLIDQNKFQRNSSPVYIDFEASPASSKPSSYKISPLKSEDLRREDITPLKRTTVASNLFSEEKMGVNKEQFYTLFATISGSHKSQEAVLIEECSSPPVGNQGFKDVSSTYISTTKNYEKIEDCSQESYLEDSYISSRCRNEIDYNKMCNIIEYEQTQSEDRTASANISFHLSPEPDKNTQIQWPAKDADIRQCTKRCEQLGQSATQLDSPSSRRRRRAKPGSLILRLNQLVRRYRSETNIWKHEYNKYMGVSKKSKINLNILRIISIQKECSRIVLHCCKDVIVNSRETETCNEDIYMDLKIIIILETLDVQNLVEGSCVRIYPPWQILELENKRTLIFLSVSKLESLSNSKLLSTKMDVETVVNKMVLQDFSRNNSQSCRCQDKCSCFSEVKGQYLPIIFRCRPVCKTAAVERYYSSRVHTIKSSVINSIIISEIHVKGYVLYEFQCRTESNRDKIISNILVTDCENTVFQIVLKTKSDERKWKLEKTKHGNIQNTFFQFSGLVVSTQLEVNRMCGLPSLLTYLKQTSNRQDYLYVLSPSCDWWNITSCGKRVATLPVDKIDNNGLLQLCSQTEEIRQNVVVTVLLFTGKKLYFQGNRLKPYGVICVDEFAVVPKIRCGYIIEICCLKCMVGMFTVDKYSVITVQEECTKHISFYLVSLPCLTVHTQAEEIVTVKGIIKEINEEYCSCDKKWKDNVFGRCQALCRTSSEKSSSIIAFIKVTELPNECIVKVKGLNRTLCSGSAVSLVCIVISVLKNEFGKAYGFTLKNL